MTRGAKAYYQHPSGPVTVDHPCGISHEAASPIDALLWYVSVELQLASPVEVRKIIGIDPGSVTRCRKGEFGIQDTWLLRLHELSSIPVAELRKIGHMPERLPHPNARKSSHETSPWKRLTGPGQIKTGDKIRFVIGSEKFEEEVCHVLDAGSMDEEILYNLNSNHYFITPMVIDGKSSHKHVEFMSKGR